MPDRMQVRTPHGVMINAGSGTVQVFTSIKTKEVHKGYERVTIKCSTGLIQALGREAHARGEKGYLRLLADAYPIRPVPDPEDIFSTTVSIEQDERLTDVYYLSYTIRRGHYLMHRVAKRHPELLREADVDPNSIPSYYGNQEEQK